MNGSDTFKLDQGEAGLLKATYISAPFYTNVGTITLDL